ncbi:MAG: hypothetical protein LBH44_02800 [Treponema sp.]|jgi:hypothetical protein|nr:hypothetical protein [Treponema sp.]
MTDPRLVQALDYILNHSDEASIEALAEAVVRRRRDFASFGAVTIDPQRMTKAITEQLTAGIGDGIESLKKTVRDMAVRIIREQAPELSNAQVDELCRAWIPEKKSEQTMPRDLLLSMIGQFVSFSCGNMKDSVDKSLRDEMGAWPERYWNAFPPVIRGIITDFLKDRITETEFNSRIGIALEL